MKMVVIGLTGLVCAAVALVLTHFLIIELGREVVVLRTPNPDRSWQETRLWMVDLDNEIWLHSKGVAWEQRFEGNPIVELTRNGNTAAYRAHPDRSRHAEVDEALRKKYGLADRWVRWLAPCDETVLPVRLTPLSAQAPNT